MKNANLTTCSVMCVFALFNHAPAFGCDLSAIYSAQNIQDTSEGATTIGVSEQYTEFHSLRLNGDWVPNTAHQSLTSSFTQVYGRYDFTKEFGLQLNIPVIARQFKRPEFGKIASDSELGLGDISLLGVFTPIATTHRDSFLRLNFRAGIKLPTGDASRLKEELEENHHEEALDHERQNVQTLHTTADDQHDNENEAETPLQIASEVAQNQEAQDQEVSENAIHGHDLALGSGSVDYILGSTIFAGRGKYFSVAEIQYALRTEGDFDYRYQNDLIYRIGVGRYIVTTHETTVSLRANISGEYKGMDTIQGNKAADTGANYVFLGPEIDLTVGDYLSIQSSLDLPVILDNTALQSVPDYRFRVSGTYVF